jgi:hypothetical protein
MSLSLRLHTSAYREGNKHWFSLLTAPPQQRIIYDNRGRSFRVWLPHLAFVLQYRQIGKDFYWEGFSGWGLRVLVKNTPFESLSDNCGSSPTENRSDGLCCTDHAMDGKFFPNSRILMGTVLNHWWSTGHYIVWPNSWSSSGYDWAKLNLQQVLAMKWSPSASMMQYSYIKDHLMGKSLINCPIRLSSQPLTKYLKSVPHEHEENDYDDEDEDEDDY